MTLFLKKKKKADIEGEGEKWALGLTDIIFLCRHDEATARSPYCTSNPLQISSSE